MKTSYILMVITIISKVFGLIREKALAYFFGASLISDVFLVAFSIPMTLTNVISGATANGYIPIYNDIQEEDSIQEANRFTSNLANIIAIFTFIISIVGILFAKQLVSVMAIGFEGEKLDTAIYMTRVGMLSLCATSVFSIFKAFLQIKKHFIVSIFHSILMNVILIVAMGVSKKLGSNYLAWGMLVAFVFQYVIFLPYIKKTGYSHNLKINLKDKNIKRLLLIIVPVLISTSVIELNFIISKSLASSLFSGAIAQLNFAYKLQGFVTGIVVTSITTAVYPEMARLGASKDYNALKDTVADAISTMAILVIPASIGLFLFASPIVNLLFVGGQFTSKDAETTALILSFYAIGIVGIGFREIVSRVFYTLMDSKTPVVNSVIMVAINVVFSFVLVGSLGIRGLALATSISFIAGAILIIIRLRNKIGNIFSKNNVVQLIKITIASAVMGVVSKICYNMLLSIVGFKLALLGGIVVAGIVYLIMLIILKVDEVKSIISKLKNKSV